MPSDFTKRRKVLHMPEKGQRSTKEFRRGGRQSEQMTEIGCDLDIEGQRYVALCDRESVEGDAFAEG